MGSMPGCIIIGIPGYIMCGGIICAPWGMRAPGGIWGHAMPGMPGIATMAIPGGGAPGGAPFDGAPGKANPCC